MVFGCALTGFIVVWVLSNADQRPHKRPVWLCRQDRAASVRRPQPYAGHGRKGLKKTVRTASRVAARSLQKRFENQHKRETCQKCSRSSDSPHVQNVPSFTVYHGS